MTPACRILGERGVLFLSDRRNASSGRNMTTNSAWAANCRQYAFAASLLMWSRTCELVASAIARASSPSASNASRYAASGAFASTRRSCRREASRSDPGRSSALRCPGRTPATRSRNAPAFRRPHDALELHLAPASADVRRPEGRDEVPRLAPQLLRPSRARRAPA